MTRTLAGLASGFCLAAAARDALSFAPVPFRPEAAADNQNIASTEVAVDSVTKLSEDPPYDIPYDPEHSQIRIIACGIGGYVLEPYNAVQIQNEGAAVMGRKRGCTMADWVACGQRDEATCNGPIPNSEKACLWVDNPPQYQETFGKGSCVFNCYTKDEINMGIGYFYDGMIRYDGNYVDLKVLADPTEGFKCLGKSAEGPDACAQTTDSQGHACSSCYVPSTWYPFHRPASAALSDGVEATPTGLDHWCLNTRGFPRLCDFLREPAPSCEKGAPYMYPPDWEGPTYPPTTSTTPATSKPTPRPAPRSSTTAPVNPAKNGNLQQRYGVAFVMLTSAVAVLAWLS